MIVKLKVDAIVDDIPRAAGWSGEVTDDQAQLMREHKVIEDDATPRVAPAGDAAN